MVRKATEEDIPRLMELLHQVNMVHYELRPDLFKPNTTKYDEGELRQLLSDELTPVFVYEQQKYGKISKYCRNLGAKFAYIK